MPKKGQDKERADADDAGDDDAAGSSDPNLLQHAVGNLLLGQDGACVELVLVDEPAAVLVGPDHHEALLLRELELVVLQNLLELVHVQAARGSLSSPLFCFLHALAAFCLNCA